MVLGKGALVAGSGTGCARRFTAVTLAVLFASVVTLTADTNSRCLGSAPQAFCVAGGKMDTSVVGEQTDLSLYSSTYVVLGEFFARLCYSSLQLRVCPIIR